MKLFIVEWRKFRGLTQEQLGEKAGLDPITINRIEKNGRTRPTSLQKLAGALGTTVEKLYEHPPVQSSEPQITLDEALQGVKRFMLHGDLTLEDVLAELLAIQAERKKRGLE